MRSVVVVVNPARVKDLPGRRRQIDAALAEAGWPPARWSPTTRSDPDTGQARQAVADGADVVLACGGDGTVRACVQAVAGTDTALAVLPAGTGNLLASNLGLPDDPTRGVELTVRAGRRRIDVGDVDGEVFAVMAGIGFDAELLHDASAPLKARIGSPAYVLSALHHLREEPMPVRIEVDDDPPRDRLARAVLVANVGRLEGGVRLLPHADPTGAYLDVAILAPRNLGQWVALAWAVIRGRNRVPRVEFCRGTRVTVTTDRDRPRELGGDVITSRRSLTAQIHPGALTLCVAEPATTLIPPRAHPEPDCDVE